MTLFQNLSAEQKSELLKLPAYIALLAAAGIKLDEEERMTAIKLAHTRSFCCEPLLAEFYLKTFKEHVVKAHHSVIEDFVFPVLIPGLN